MGVHYPFIFLLSFVYNFLSHLLFIHVQKSELFPSEERRCEELISSNAYIQWE